MSLTVIQERTETVLLMVQVVKDQDGTFFVLLRHGRALIRTYDEDDGVEDEESAIDLYNKLIMRYGLGGER